MIEKTEDEVRIKVNADELYKSMALLSDMRDFCEEQSQIEEGKKETAEALNIAIETMAAFWAEHFAEEGDHGQQDA